MGPVEVVGEEEEVGVGVLLLLVEVVGGGHDVQEVEEEAHGQKVAEDVAEAPAYPPVEEGAVGHGWRWALGSGMLVEDDLGEVVGQSHEGEGVPDRNAH